MYRLATPLLFVAPLVACGGGASDARTEDVRESGDDGGSDGSDDQDVEGRDEGDDVSFGNGTAEVWIVNDSSFVIDAIYAAPCNEPWSGNLLDAPLEWNEYLYVWDVPSGCYDMEAYDYVEEVYWTNYGVDIDDEYTWILAD